MKQGASIFTFGINHISIIISTIYPPFTLPWNAIHD